MVQRHEARPGPADRHASTIGASATDYVGHAYGTEGPEMCIQIAKLDRTLGEFFAVLDETGVDYVVVLTADHGGNDLPERERERGMPTARRASTPTLLAKHDRRPAIAATLGLTGPVAATAASTATSGSTPTLTAGAARQRAGRGGRAAIARIPQVAGGLHRGARSPRRRCRTARPRPGRCSSARAPRSIRSGRATCVVLLKPRVTPIADPTPAAMSRRMAASGITTAACRSCSGARA